MELTIAIPSYKRPTQLAATLIKLLGHAWNRDVRYLILVNQPDTGYEEALAPFADNPAVRIVKQRTHCSVWQQCCALGSEVETEYILHVSDDDEIVPEAVEVYLSVMDGAPDLVGAFAPVLYCNEQGEHIMSYNQVNDVTLIEKGDFVTLVNTLGDNLHWPELGLFRTRLIQHNNAHHPHIDSALLQIAEALRHGKVLFGQLSFYRFILHKTNSQHHIGSQLPLNHEYLESAQFSIDLLFQSAMDQLGANASTVQEYELMVSCRKLKATRIRETYYHLVAASRHAEAVAMRKRLQASGISIMPTPRPSFEIAALELALAHLQSMTWLDYLVVFRLTPLVDFAKALGITKTIAVETPQDCARYAESAFFLCFEAHLNVVAQHAPLKHIRTFEALTNHFELTK